MCSYMGRTHGKVGVLDLDIWSVTLVKIYTFVSRRFKVPESKTNLKDISQRFKKCPVIVVETQIVEVIGVLDPLINGLRGI